MESNKPLYFTQLDALRFFAFFLVFWQHGVANLFLGLTINPTYDRIIQALAYSGGMGVHIFFVISGFLITYLMMKEKAATGKINLKFFYIRRFLRIWPLYYLILILGIFILPHLINTFEFSGSYWKNLLFLNNYDMEGHAPNVGIAWSVAIEEQFYLFWPIIVILTSSKKPLYYFVTGSLIVASTIYIILYPSESYFNTFGNINYLMVGGIGGMLFSKWQKHPQLQHIFRAPFLYFDALLILLIVAFRNFNEVLFAISVIILPLLYLYVVVYMVYKSLHSNRPPSVFSILGKYTYGMYLYHPMIIIFVKIAFDKLKIPYDQNNLWYIFTACICMLLTIAVSMFSYRYFEKPILGLKSKFSMIKTRI